MALPIALRNLLRRPLRSGLTLLGIALGAATYVILASAAAGLAEETEMILRGLRADLIVQRAGVPVPWNSRIAPEELDALRGVPGVTEISPVVVGVTKIATRSRFYVFGAAPATLATLGLELSNGRIYAPGNDEILAGTDAARELELSPGDRVAIVGRREFKVVGVYRTGRRLLDSGVMLDVSDAQQAFRLGKLVNLALVSLSPASRPEEAAAALVARAPELDATPVDLFAQNQEWFQAVRRFARALAVLALVIAALGVSNTLSMNVAERTGEIGLLRALGWRRARIARLVVWEGLCLALGGATLGFPIAAAALGFLGRRDVFGVIPAHLPVPTAVEGIAAVLLAGLLASLPPLVHALRIRPARALREL